MLSSAPPLLWYDFEDSGNPTANLGSLGVAFDGQLMNGATIGAFCCGVGVLLDGSEDYVLPNGGESAFDLSDNDYSVFARVITSHSDTCCGNQEQGVIWKERFGGSGTPGYTFGVIKASGLLRMSLFDAANLAETLVGVTPINDGLPHEILGVRRDNALVIGGRTLGGITTDDFDGSIGEVRVYAEAVMPGPSVCASYCSSLPNATGAAAKLTCSGDPSCSLKLTSTPVPNTTGQFFYGTSMLAGNPFGDGLLCVGGMTTRMLPFVSAGMMMQLPNTATFTINYGAPYATGLTGTKHFQHWYRSGLATGSGFNTSDALSITF